MRHPLLLGISLMLAGCGAPAVMPVSESQQPVSGSAIAHEHVVRLRPGTSPEAFARRHGLDLVQAIGLDMYVLRGARPLAALDEAAETLWVEPNRRLTLPPLASRPAPRIEGTFPDDPLLPAQYAPRVTGAERVWATQTGRPEVVVAIVDSGIDGSHPEFQGQLLPGQDFTVTPPAPGGDRDGYGHGTHVAGVVGARLNNGTGIAGIAPGCKLLPVRIFNDMGHTTEGAANAALIWAVDHGAKVINASWGTPSDSAAGRTAIRYALDHDVVVVAAVGNTGKEWDPSYPAAYEGVVAVAGTTDIDGWASFSTYGDWITLGAPGAGILSTYPLSKGTGYRIMDGTSMAAPCASGVAALVRSQHPQLTQAQVVGRLYATARDTVMTGKDKYVGYGRVDAARAVLEAR